MTRTIDIDPEGDVFLVCGEGGSQYDTLISFSRGVRANGSVRNTLRVCSKTVSKASPVFKSMLSTSFHEGTQLLTRGSVELQLQEDHAASMATICRIAHLQPRLVPDSIPTSELLEIARLCDKYDFREILKARSFLWITCALQAMEKAEDDSAGGRDALLIAAYHFGNAQCFFRVGHEMITREVDEEGSTASQSWPTSMEEGLEGVFGRLPLTRERCRLIHRR